MRTHVLSIIITLRDVVSVAIKGFAWYHSCDRARVLLLVSGVC